MNHKKVFKQLTKYPISNGVTYDTWMRSQSDIDLCTAYHITHGLSWSKSNITWMFKDSWAECSVKVVVVVL